MAWGEGGGAGGTAPVLVVCRVVVGEPQSKGHVCVFVCVFVCVCVVTAVGCRGPFRFFGGSASSWVMPVLVLCFNGLSSFLFFK